MFFVNHCGCLSGKAKYAVNAVKEHGFYFSIPPSIVRDPQMAKMVKQLPLEHLVLESDSPSLGPVKQQRNEPANVSISCRAIALLKNLSVEQVAKQTNANAKLIFPKITALNDAE